MECPSLELIPIPADASAADIGRVFGAELPRVRTSSPPRQLGTRACRAAPWLGLPRRGCRHGPDRRDVQLQRRSPAWRCRGDRVLHVFGLRGRDTPPRMARGAHSGSPPPGRREGSSAQTAPEPNASTRILESSGSRGPAGRSTRGNRPRSGSGEAGGGCPLMETAHDRAGATRVTIDPSGRKTMRELKKSWSDRSLTRFPRRRRGRSGARADAPRGESHHVVISLPRGDVVGVVSRARTSTTRPIASGSKRTVRRRGSAPAVVPRRDARPFARPPT